MAQKSKRRSSAPKATVRRASPAGRPAAAVADPTPTPTRGAHVVGGLRAAFVVLTLDALGLLGGGIYLAVRSTGHDATDHRAAVTQAVFALLGALIFGVLAFGTRPWHPSLAARTPAMILEIIFVPVSIGLFQSGRPEIGTPFLLSALVAIVGLVLGFQSRNDDR